MGPATGTVSDVVPTAGRTLDGGFVNSAVNRIYTTKSVKKTHKTNIAARKNMPLVSQKTAPGTLSTVAA